MTKKKFLIVFNTKTMRNSALQIFNQYKPSPSLISGDVNGDGHVSMVDYSIFVSKYGTSDQVCDFNKNGSVDMGDYAVLIANYGK